MRILPISRVSMTARVHVPRLAETVSARLKSAHAPRQQIDPGADAHFLALAHHLERLVEQRLARHLAVDHFDVPIRQRKASPRGILHDRYPMSQRELEHDAAWLSVALLWVRAPRREYEIESFQKAARSDANQHARRTEIALLVLRGQIVRTRRAHLQTEQQHLLHQRELGRHAVLVDVAEIPRVVRDLRRERVRRPVRRALCPALAGATGLTAAADDVLAMGASADVLTAAEVSPPPCRRRESPPVDVAMPAPSRESASCDASADCRALDASRSDESGVEGSTGARDARWSADVRVECRGRKERARAGAIVRSERSRGASDGRRTRKRCGPRRRVAASKRDSESRPAAAAPWLEDDWRRSRGVARAVSRHRAFGRLLEGRSAACRSALRRLICDALERCASLNSRTCQATVRRFGRACSPVWAAQRSIAWSLS